MTRPARSPKIAGRTDLISEKNVPKNDQRIKAIGAVDEASASLGLARSFTTEAQVNQLLLQAQKDLSQIMSTMAGSNQFLLSSEGQFSPLEQAFARLEDAIKKLETATVFPKEFIFSGENQLSGVLDLARTAVRRAEWEVVQLYNNESSQNSLILQYLNRLSTLCYLLELRALA